MMIFLVISSKFWFINLKLIEFINIKLKRYEKSKQDTLEHQRR